MTSGWPLAEKSLCGLIWVFAMQWAAVSCDVPRPPAAELRAALALDAICTGTIRDDHEAAVSRVCEDLKLANLSADGGAPITERSYKDISRVQRQAEAGDNVPPAGVDTATLLFVASDGRAIDRGWEGPGGQWVLNENVLFGNASEGGRMRYLWQCACHVFAHGPCSQFAPDGTCVNHPSPGGFTGDAGQANVISGWRSAIGPGLRLACGGSSVLLCNGDTASEIGRNRSNGLSFADAFILGLLDTKTVPVCLTRGPEAPGGSLLYERAFTRDPNPFTRDPNPDGQPPFHLQYALIKERGFEDPPTESVGKVVPSLPPLQLIPDKSVRRDTIRPSLAGPRPTLPPCQTERPTPMEGIEACYNPLTPVPTSTTPDPPDTYRRAAARFLKLNGWDKWEGTSSLSEPRVIYFTIDTYPYDCGLDGNQCRRTSSTTKGIVLMFRRAFGAAPDRKQPGIPERGPGGKILVWMNTKARVVAASRDWQIPRGPRPRRMDELLQLEEATPLALAELNKMSKGRASHGVPITTWGFRERDGELQPVYVFDFPVGEADSRGEPATTAPATGLVRIEIPAVRQ